MEIKQSNNLLIKILFYILYLILIIFRIAKKEKVIPSMDLYKKDKDRPKLSVIQYQRTKSSNR